MKYLITLFQTTQDRNGIFHRRLIHHNRLETTLQRRILLNVLTVLIQSGRADAVQLATGQHRLQHIAGVHSSVGLACAHNQVQLIDEEDDLALALPDLLQNGFQTLLKFAAVLGAGHQRAHIQGKYLLVLQTLRYIAPHDTLCQTLHNGGLADAGFTDQNRVILGLTGQNPNHIPDLRVTTDDRVKLLIPCLFHQVRTIFT